MKTLAASARALLALVLALVVARAAYEAACSLVPPPAPPVPRRYVHPLGGAPLPREEGGHDPCPR